MPVCTEEEVITVSGLRQLVKGLQAKELYGFRSRQYNRACVDLLTVLAQFQISRITFHTKETL